MTMMVMYNYSSTVIYALSAAEREREREGEGERLTHLADVHAVILTLNGRTTASACIRETHASQVLAPSRLFSKC